MAITLSSAASTAAINAACNAIVDLVDGGAGAGTIVLKTAVDAEVARLTFSDPAFGSAAAGVATANAITNDSDAAGNASPVTKFAVEDSDVVEVWTGAVAESASDLNIDDGTPGGGVVIDTNAVVSISSITFTIAFV